AKYSLRICCDLSKVGCYALDSIVHGITLFSFFAAFAALRETKPFHATPLRTQRKRKAWSGYGLNDDRATGQNRLRKRAALTRRESFWLSRSFRPLTGGGSDPYLQ